MSVTGTETSTTTYVYDKANRLTTETKGSVVTLYVYDANGNLLSEVCGQSVLGFRYNARNQLTSAAVNGVTVGVYTYNADGIRTAKLSTDGVTYFLLDGGYVVGETTASTVKATYLYGANLIRRDTGTDTAYYLYNAHGDVVNLAGSAGTSTKSYKYDAFGNEDDPDEDDTNPFRYCAEYFDKETGTYYLRARYYDPTTGRFTQQDTHWNTANSIYGDDLRLSTYAYIPQITAIMQSANLYVYCIGNPLCYKDRSGEISEIALGAIVGAVVNTLVYCVTASASGQKITGEGIIVAAASGALVGAGDTARIIGGVIAGGYTAVEALKAGASFETALADGALAGFATVATASGAAQISVAAQYGVSTVAIADTVFGIGISGISAGVHSGIVSTAEPHKTATHSSDTSSAISPPYTPAKPGGGGGGGKSVMVMR